MNDTRNTLNFGNKTIILIGTAHISQESIDEVKQVIRDVKPSHVSVELDAGRHTAMTQKEKWENLDMVKVFKEGKAFLLMANLVLAGFQKRMGSEIGIKPGEEMRAALETAEALNIPHSLSDREVHTTLRRAWANCNFWNKCKLLAALFAGAFSTEKLKPEEIENLKKKNELDAMMSELSDFLPGVKKVLIDERDQYLAGKIWKAAQDMRPHDSADQQSLVAIVGAGHIEGIKKHLEKISAGKESSDVEALEAVPKKSLLSKSIGFLIPALLLGLMITGFISKGLETVMSMLLYWFILNGTLSAIGSIIALGHPLSVLVSFLGAPFTSLSPFVGVGFISGLVQVNVRKPRVLDFQTISDSIYSIKGIYTNRISKALLVFFMSSIGSSIGTFVAYPIIIGLLKP